MKRKYWKIRNIISQIFILLLLGFALLWIRSNIQHLQPLLAMKWLNLIFAGLAILYIIFCVGSINTMIADHVIHPYNPADPKSLAKLAKVEKYKLDTVLLSQIKRQGNIVQMITDWFDRQNYQQVAKHRLGLIFEKKTPFINHKFQSKYHRIFLLYRPILNVLIVDNILSETLRFIESENLKKPVSQNNLILITDMKNEEEILSAGAGIVNYVSTEQTSYLYPIFLDMSHAHLFYPQDISLFPWYKRLARKFKIISLKSWLKNNIQANKP
ncbi:MAG: hypothetical protein GX217_06650 [Clostridiaceae bacterium]|nr:hypothetical protein [Clostridiaceae bacterium]